MKKNFYLLMCFLGFLVACSPSTKITKSWTDPSWKQADTALFKKVLVVCPLKSETSRRFAEDKLVASIKKMDAVQSYNYLKSADTAQGQREEKLKKDGFDCIILMRLVDVDKNLSYTPGTPYAGWYGYSNSTPANYSEDRTFYVETDFYSLAQKKLIWSATTSTLNPTQIDQTLSDIISAVKTELSKKGLIKK